MNIQRTDGSLVNIWQYRVLEVTDSTKASYQRGNIPQGSHVVLATYRDGFSIGLYEGDASTCQRLIHGVLEVIKRHGKYLVIDNMLASFDKWDADYKIEKEKQDAINASLAGAGTTDREDDGRHVDSGIGTAETEGRCSDPDTID